jgi:hypothetical protein
VLSALRRGWTPTSTPARIEHAGLLDDATLRLFTCNPVIRTVLLAPNGAVLDLGRTQRLASARQKTTLLARDGGCVAPGCAVPGDACDAHHVIPWTTAAPRTSTTWPSSAPATTAKPTRGLGRSR